MAQHRQTEQDAQHTETKLFFMFLFGRIKQAKQRLGVVVDVIVVVDVKYFCLKEEIQMSVN